MSIEENIRVEEIRVLNCPSVARINLALTPNPLPTNYPPLMKQRFKTPLP